jgi:hypothetical protein
MRPWLMRWSLAACALGLSIACQRQSSESPVASPPRPILAQAQALAAAPTPYPTRVPRPMPTRGAPTAVPAPTSASPQPSPAPPTIPPAGSTTGRSWIVVDELGAPAWTSAADGTTFWADSGHLALVEIRRGGRCYLYELRLRESRP